MGNQYEYPQEALDLQAANRLQQAWLDARTEKDRALLQLVGFLLAGTLAILSQEPVKVVGNRQIWVLVVALLATAGAALVRILHRDSVLMHGLWLQHETAMLARSDRARIGEADPDTPNEPVAETEADLACLDDLALGSIALAGIVAVANLGFAVLN